MDKKKLLPYAVSVALLIALLLFFDFRKITDSVLGFNVLLFFLIVALYLMCYFYRAFAWKLIVRPFASISFWESFNIISVSFLANYFLPLRAGEIIRVGLLSKIKSIPKSVALSTVIVNRLVEITLLVFLFFSGFFLLPLFDYGLAVPVFFAGILFFGTLAVFLFHEKFFFFAGKFLPTGFIPGWFRRVVKNIFVGGLALSQSKKNSFEIFFFTAITWVIHVLIYSVASQGMGLRLGFAELLLVVSFSSLSSMIPSSPGFIGTFQASFVAIFLALGLDSSAGLGMSIVLHLSAYLSTVLAGLFSLRNLGFSFSDIFGKKFFPKKNPGLE